MRAALPRFRLLHERDAIQLRGARLRVTRPWQDVDELRRYAGTRIQASRRADAVDFTLP